MWNGNNNDNLYFHQMLDFIIFVFTLKGDGIRVWSKGHPSSDKHQGVVELLKLLPSDKHKGVVEWLKLLYFNVGAKLTIAMTNMELIPALLFLSFWVLNFKWEWDLKQLTNQNHHPQLQMGDIKQSPASQITIVLPRAVAIPPPPTATSLQTNLQSTLLLWVTIKSFLHEFFTKWSGI